MYKTTYPSDSFHQFDVCSKERISKKYIKLRNSITISSFKSVDCINFFKFSLQLAFIITLYSFLWSGSSKLRATLDRNTRLTGKYPTATDELQKRNHVFMCMNVISFLLISQDLLPFTSEGNGKVMFSKVFVYRGRGGGELYRPTPAQMHYQSLWEILKMSR